MMIKLFAGLASLMFGSASLLYALEGNVAMAVVSGILAVPLGMYAVIAKR